jgi:hypothetical protein
VHADNGATSYRWHDALYAALLRGSEALTNAKVQTGPDLRRAQ